MFRFTIRDLLWLTVVVGLSVGWWVNRAQLIRSGNARQRAEEIKRTFATREAIALRQLADALAKELPEGSTINTRFYKHNVAETTSPDEN